MENMKNGLELQCGLILTFRKNLFLFLLLVTQALNILYEVRALGFWLHNNSIVESYKHDAF